MSANKELRHRCHCPKCDKVFDNRYEGFHGGESEIVEMVWPPFKIILTDKERNPEP